MDTALDPLLEGVASRSGVIRTADVSRRTVLLLLRFRYHIVTQQGRQEIPLLAEACEVVAFAGRPSAPHWLTTAEAEALMLAQPGQNVLPVQATAQIEQVLASVAELQPALNAIAERKGQEVLAAHERVREAARQKGVRHAVQPQLPPDVLGVYVLLPVID